MDFLRFRERVGIVRNFVLLVCAFLFLGVLGGCQESESGAREYLVINFEPENVLRYKLISERDVTIDLETPSRPDVKNKSQKMSERLELVMAYEPVEVDPFGLTTIEAVCESAKVSRSSFTKKASPRDAVENLAGKKFVFQVSPTGKIADHTRMTELVQELGEKAFAANSKQKFRVKNPDMITDFVALQWYLWDSISTIEEPLEGVNAGGEWKTLQLVPMPVPRLVVRETTYTFNEAMDTHQGRKATITSQYKLSEETLDNWPKPYEGVFQMKGSLFSVLRGYQVTSLEGSGSQTFNIDKGVVEKEQQQYQVNVDASFILPLGDSQPKLIIDQEMSIELLNN